MKNKLMSLLCITLIKICDLTHMLNDSHEERLQSLFIATIGYHCPFAMWSYQINKRYGLNVWKKHNTPLEPTREGRVENKD